MFMKINEYYMFMLSQYINLHNLYDMCMSYTFVNA